MEKPRIRKIERRDRVLRSGYAGLCFGPSEWICEGRKVEAFGLDPAAAYGNWRFMLRREKLHGISMARYKRWQAEQVASGWAYQKPDGTIKNLSVDQRNARARQSIGNGSFYELPRLATTPADPWWKFW